MSRKLKLDPRKLRGSFESMGESRFSAEAPRNPFPPHLRGPGEAKTGNKHREKGIRAGNIFSKRKDIFSKERRDVDGLSNAF